MKFIDRIIADIPLLDIEKTDSEYHNEMKYYVDTRILIDKLRDYEIEIPKEYFDKYEQVFGNGVLQYMEYLTGESSDEFMGGNTYNYNGRALHDLDYRYCSLEDNFYVAIQVHRFGDVRGNYTEFALFRFDYYESFWEIIDDICTENCGGCIEYNNKHYYYDMSPFNENLRVWCQETGQEFESFACDDKGFIEDIEENGKV